MKKWFSHCKQQGFFVCRGTFKLKKQRYPKVYVDFAFPDLLHCSSSVVMVAVSCRCFWEGLLVRHSLKFFLISAFLVLFFLVIFPLESAPPGSEVRFQNGRLSAVFVKAPIRDALAQVAARTGVSIFLDPEIKVTISSRFEDLSLRAAFRRLLKNQSYAFVFSGDSKNKDRIESVKVFREGRFSSVKYEVLGGEGYILSPLDSKKVAGEKGGAVGKSTATVAVSVGDGVDGVGEKGAAVLPSAAAINPRSTGARAQVMAAISRVQRNLDYLQRKSAGEKRALRRSISEVQRELASSSNPSSSGTIRPDPSAALKKLQTLEAQEARLEQSNYARKIDAQKEMAILMEKMTHLSSPVTQKQEYAQRQKRQAEAMRSQAERRRQAAHRGRVARERAKRHTEGL